MEQSLKSEYFSRSEKNQDSNDSVNDNMYQWENDFFKSVLDKVDVKNEAKSTEVFILNAEKVIALVMLLVATPIMILVAIGIKLTTKGNILYSQTRVGKDGSLFEIYKFRSMIDKAEELTGHVLSWDNDPRVTRFGSFLRKSHLDELPQLLNVLKGEMSFVGPRPERPEFTAEYDVIIQNYRARASVRPGITGLAQIACEYDSTPEKKLKFDLLYIKYRNSYLLNILIAFYTAKKMLLMNKTANIVNFLSSQNKRI